MTSLDTLMQRADHACELCGATDGLAAWQHPADAERDDADLVACATCRAQLDGGDLDARHWTCLHGAAWSEVPAVQVTAWRLLHALTGEPWASDLVAQIWLDEATTAWAQAGLPDTAPAGPTVTDAHGTPLADGDTVTLVKDLDVKGAGFTAKRGTTVKGIRLGDVEGHVEGRVNGTSVYLKTEFLKKLG